MKYHRNTFVHFDIDLRQDEVIQLSWLCAKKKKKKKKKLKKKKRNKWRVDHDRLDIDALTSRPGERFTG